MNIKTCQFVEASEVFKGCPLAKDAFVEAEPNCTWGDNIHSMVSPNEIVETLEEELEIVENEENNEKLTEEIKTVLHILASMPADVYVDLEN